MDLRDEVYQQVFQRMPSMNSVAVNAIHHCQCPGFFQSLELNHYYY